MPGPIRLYVIPFIGFLFLFVLGINYIIDYNVTWGVCSLIGSLLWFATLVGNIVAEFLEQGERHEVE